MFIAMSSDTLSPIKVDDYAESLLARELSTVDGVGQVQVFGASRYAVRIQADPAALATRQIGIDQVAAAVAAPMSTRRPARSMATRAPRSSKPTASSTMPRIFPAR